MEPRKRIAREAARLLYRGYEEEYIEAKKRAARELSLSSMPSNFEVAVELDRLAEEFEGRNRIERLKNMRRTALNIMSLIEDYEPRLIGSVWRGTARKGSDIDISVYSTDLMEIKNRLDQRYSIKRIERKKYSLDKMPKTSHHIYLTAGGYNAEVVVRHPKDRHPEYCEIYGDRKRGLTFKELDKLMREDPLRKFIPNKR